MTRQELEQLTFRYFPPDFWKRVLQSVFQAHTLSWQDCSANFAGTEAENVQPYYKRGKLEGYLRDVAAMFPGMTTQVVRAEQSNWYHTEVHAGPIVLTENSVPTPCALIEKADFRLTLARDAQGTLFPDERLAADSPLYVLLLHSKSRWDDPGDRRTYRHLPGSAYIAIPSVDLTHYLHEISLFERFPEVVAAHIPKDWGREAQVRYVRQSRKTVAL
jgi:hypothetical protein